MIKKLTLKEVEYMAHHLAKKLMDWDEPIPDFSTRFPHKLESCIETPFMTYAKRSLYQGLEKKAAVLFYLLIKNHPFQNGNKRIAVTTLLVFLMKNKRWLNVSPQEFYNFAAWVAGSPADVKEETIKGIASFIRKHIEHF
ncbi:MAG: type II toxin-antitoxin system death-on-curing family toxin [Candidatus Peregrinibacteria bacterium]